MNSSKPTSSLSNSGDNSEMPKLANDILYECLARVPLSFHPVISQVSKMFKDFVVTKRIYEERLRIKCLEPVMYICLGSWLGNQDKWYLLTKKAHTDEFVLVHLPLFPPVPDEYSLITYGSKVYAISGENYGDQASKAFSIDCLQYVTANLPSMKDSRRMPYTLVIDGTLYAIGGVCIYKDSPNNWIEAFKLEPEGSEWESVPCVPHGGGIILGTAVVMNGSIYYLNEIGCGCVYNIKEDRFHVENELGGSLWYYTSCVIEDRLYVLADNNQIKAYDPIENYWTDVKGLANLPDLEMSTTQMVSYGSKLIIVHNRVRENIWCTEVSLERRGREIWGEIGTNNRALHLDFSTVVIKRCHVVMM